MLTWCLHLKTLWCPRAMLGSTALPLRSSASSWREDFSSMSSALVCLYSWYLQIWIYTDARAGQTGLGKSTLINTIFASHLIDSKGRLTPSDPVRSTTEIQAVSHGMPGRRVWDKESAKTRNSDRGKWCSPAAQHRGHPRLRWSSQQWQMVRSENITWKENEADQMQLGPDC